MLQTGSGFRDTVFPVYIVFSADLHSYTHSYTNSYAHQPAPTDLAARVRRSNRGHDLRAMTHPTHSPPPPSPPSSSMTSIAAYATAASHPHTHLPLLELHTHTLTHTHTVGCPLSPWGGSSSDRRLAHLSQVSGGVTGNWEKPQPSHSNCSYTQSGWSWRWRPLTILTVRSVFSDFVLSLRPLVLKYFTFFSWHCKTCWLMVKKYKFVPSILAPIEAICSCLRWSYLNCADILQRNNFFRFGTGVNSPEEIKPA